jgi:hypothetical protein
MKKVLFITAVVSGLVGLTAFTTTNHKHSRITFISSSDKYCEGWEDGYCEGWKDVKGQFAICPIAPICPIAEIGKDRYKDGYNRGFKAGYNAAKK